MDSIFNHLKVFFKVNGENCLNKLLNRLITYFYFETLFDKKAKRQHITYVSLDPQFNFLSCFSFKIDVLIFISLSNDGRWFPGDSVELFVYFKGRCFFIAQWGRIPVIIAFYF